MAAQIDIFIQNLLSSISSSGAEPVNMSERCKWLGFDIVGLLAFGFQLHVQTEPQYRFILRGLVAGNFQSNTFMQFPLLKQTGLNTLLRGLGNSSRNKFLSTLDHMASTRLSQGRDARTDLVSFVAEGTEGKALDDAQLRELLYSEGLCKQLIHAGFNRASCYRYVSKDLSERFFAICKLQLADFESCSLLSRWR